MINALRHYGHNEPIAIFGLELQTNQRVALQLSDVEIHPLSSTNPWEAKAEALCKPLFDLTTFIDADALPVSNLTELFNFAAAGLISGGKDQEKFYGEEYQVYGFAEPFHNDRYFSSSIWSFDRTVHQDILERWASIMTLKKDDNWPGYGDQGVLNAVVCSTPGKFEQINLLPNELWSCHWTYLSHLPVLINPQKVYLRNPNGQMQRSLHTPSMPKFWDPNHFKAISKNGPIDAYVVFLKFLFEGPIRVLRGTIPDFLWNDYRRFQQVIQPLGQKRPQSPSVTAVKKKGLILRNFQSPGDILVMTAAVRDLKRWYPELNIDVRTSAQELWENNPYLSNLQESDSLILDAEYGRNQGGLIHQSNQRQDIHFLNGFIEDLNAKLGLFVKLTEFKPDIHLTAQERTAIPFMELQNVDDFWIIVSGGKNDFPAKHVPVSFWQQVIDGLPNTTFVQLGAMEQGDDPTHQHVHPPLQGSNVIDLRGRTSLRDCLTLIYHSSGVTCNVTFFMHAAAALNRPCVVVAGGREPWWWERYPGHDFLHTMGKLSCCASGGCWLAKCPKLINDVPQCLTLIKAEEVIQKIQEKKHLPSDRGKRGLMSLDEASQVSTWQDTLVISFKREIHPAKQHILIQACDLLDVLQSLRHIKFRDCYLFDCEPAADRSDVHRIWLAIQNLGEKAKKVFICRNDPPTGQWTKFLLYLGHITEQEGLKQIS